MAAWWRNRTPQAQCAPGGWCSHAPGAAGGSPRYGQCSFHRRGEWTIGPPRHRPGISKAFEGKTVVKNFSTRIARGDRIGIVGPNGAGKTTLLKMLTGQLEPDAGEVRLGSGIDMVSLDQRRDELAPTMTVKEALVGKGDKVIINGQPRHVASYMKDFLFQPEQAFSPVSVLSGGERARLMLARALAKPSNLLVLDEPTNDLDLETLDLLQELLAEYAGTVLLVSHDRDFLDRVVTSVIAAEGDGRGPVCSTPTCWRSAQA